MTTTNPKSPTRWPAQLMALAAAGGIVLTLAHPSATRQFTWPWVLLLSLLWLAPLAAGLGSLLRAGPWVRPNKLLTTGLLLLAAATLLSAALSPLANQSLLRVWPTLGGVALIFWLGDWLAAKSSRAGRLTQGLTMFGAILALASLGGWIAKSAGISGVIRNDIPFGHSTYTAGVMLLVLPWLVRATWTGRGVWRVGGIVAVAAALGALFATSSRGGVLAVGAVAVLAVGLALIRAPWSRRAKILVVLAVGAVLAAAVLSNPRLRELARGGAWGESSRDSNEQRRAMLEAGVRLGTMRPLTGWGPGTVPLAYPKVRGQLSGGVDDVLQLHNAPAQLWATLGAGGLLAALLILAAVARRLGQLWRTPDPLALTSTASLAVYGLFALTDHQLDLPAMNALLGLNLVLLFHGAARTQPLAASTSLRWLGCIAVIALLAPLLWLTGRDLFARSYYEQSLTLFEHGRDGDGFAALKSAADAAPYDPYYRHQLAGRLLGARLMTRDQAVQARLTAEATAQLEQSLAAGCFEEFAHFNLGWLAIEAGKPAEAARHFTATVRAAPHRGGAYFGLGLALRRLGDQPGAVRAFALEWLNDPMAFTAPVWEWPDFAPLRAPVAREADAILAALAPTQPTARYVRELWAWWADNNILPTGGFNAESKAFVTHVRLLARTEFVRPASPDYRWLQLFNAWQQTSDRTALAAVVGHDAPFAAALRRRALRQPATDWHGFLCAGLENEPALLASLQPARTGYGVLALHPDGPVLTDLYIMQENRLVSTFASGLFPAKGWLPARELLERLPPLPATP